MLPPIPTSVTLTHPVLGVKAAIAAIAVALFAHVVLTMALLLAWSPGTTTDELLEFIADVMALDTAGFTLDG